MSNGLEDWLSSVGIDMTNSDSRTPNESRNEVVDGEIHPATEEEPQVTSLSDNDFDDILSDIGFEEAHDEDSEEEVDWIEEDEAEGREEEEENNSILETADAAFRTDSIITAAEYYADGTVEYHVDLGNAATQSVETAPVVQEEAAVAEPERPPLIPPNSPTLLLDESTSRFSGAEWYNAIRRTRIILAGLGGIGSWLSLQLARMSPDILILYDDDRVELANMSGQMYAHTDVGKPKANAIYDTIDKYATTQNVFAVSEKFTENTEAGDIMMCGFDNMEARKLFFLKWQEHVGALSEEDRKKCFFLDGRLSIDTLQVFCLTGNDTYNIGRYSNNYLFDDSEAEHTVCSMKQTTYLACMIGSFMVNLFTNWVANLLTNTFI